MSFKRFALFAPLLAAALPAAAQDRTADFLSGNGTKVFLAAGLLAPLLRDGKDGTNHFARTGEALVFSTAATYFLKTVTHVRRPDGNGNDSFPSGHTSAAFTIATMEAGFHPNEAPYWYAGAAAIGWSRVKLERHSVADVAVGALIGYSAAQLELRHEIGVLISPFLTRSGKPGVNLLVRF